MTPTLFYVRAALRWLPTDWLEGNLAFQRQNDHSEGFSWQTEGLSYETEALVPQQPEARPPTCNRSP